MLSSNNFLNPTSERQVLTPIVQFPPPSNEEAGHPDLLIQSLNNCKNRLQLFQEEVRILRKIIKWNAAKIYTPENQDLWVQFEELSVQEFQLLQNALMEVEKQIIAALLNNEAQSVSPFREIHKIERQLNKFNDDWIPVRLKILKEIAEHPCVSFF